MNGQNNINIVFILFCPFRVTNQPYVKEPDSNQYE